MATVKNDVLVELTDSRNGFDVGDLELEIVDSNTLGDTQDAREDHGVSDINIGRTSLDSVFNEIHYGLYKSRPACRIFMTLNLKSDSSFRLAKANLTCTVASDSTSQVSVSSNDIVRPSILKVAPPPLDDANPTSVGIAATLDVSPSVSIPNGPEVSIGSFTKQKTYTETYGWHLHSTARSSEAQLRTSRDTAVWTFTANKMQKDSQMHSFEIEVLVRHANEPFYAIFELKGTLVFRDSIRAIGKRRKICTRRNFSPHKSLIIFS